jgi:hypothetical protein
MTTEPKATRQRSGTYVGGLIGALGAGLSVLLFEFGGWEYRVDYAGTTLTRWGAFGMFDGVLYFALLAPVVVAAGYVGFVSFRQLAGQGLGATHARNALWVASGALVVLVAYSLIFEAQMAADENDDWWLDSGFYGGAFGFAAAGVSLYAARRAGAGAAD